ncbi:MAG TPA: hypothetical protein VFB82_23215, partial [Blastocatellia bacterium]|nr:hypothetical protein [Blastocatellia bacterium]
MRKTWLALFLVALIAPAITTLKASDAGSSQAPGSDLGGWQSTIIGLPDFDLRREIAQAQPQSGSADDSALVQKRTSAIESFRARFSPETRDDLRYEINEAGVPKTFFNLA